jgi:hypothetical protein
MSKSIVILIPKENVRPFYVCYPTLDNNYYTRIVQRAMCVHKKCSYRYVGEPTKQNIFYVEICRCALLKHRKPAILVDSPATLLHMTGRVARTYCTTYTPKAKE